MTDVDVQRAIERASELLSPYALRRQAEVENRAGRFVHYTGAIGARSIIMERRMWMRNATCMNDYTEMRFGLERVFEAYASPSGMRFQTALNAVRPGFTEALQAHFNPWQAAILEHTYVCCFSEHKDEEDDHGRLSMWRAYGGDCGVAMVMNNPAFVSPSDALNAWTTPVSYVGRTEVIDEFETIAAGIEQEADLLRTIPEDRFLNQVFLALVFMAVSIKHIGFAEEAEWRVVHMPLIFPSDKLQLDNVVWGGVPQPVFKIPLQNFPDEEFRGAELPELLNRIIIGPTQFPLAMRMSFIQLLADAGITNASERVFCSGVPLRT